MGASAPTPPPPERDRLLDQLLAALLAADQVAAQSVVDRALKLGWSADGARFELITPALHEVGARWERGEIGVADEHLATSVCEWLLITLAGRLRRPRTTGRRALVGCSEGELHTLGALIVANLLSEHGWSVLFLGASTPVDAWRAVVGARRPDLVAVATTRADRLGQVGPILRAIRAARPQCRTVVGGQAYARVPGAVPDVGADLVVVDARELPGRLAARGTG
jgi:MerR family transcriptional regulator, light-induced transcriptional regulator